MTAAIFRCECCGFLQCPETTDVLALYEDMEDPGYTQTAGPRALQARRLVKLVGAFCPAPARLLDVGAGIGLLLDEAEKRGFSAVGVEPSRWLSARAQQGGHEVHCGVLPHKDIVGPFDAVCLIDVIEHVSDPVGLLRTIRDVMAPDGKLIMVTPDVKSVMARLMGRNWWHFRAAHIGYFDRTTLEKACRAAGLRPIHVSRPCWYFNADYLWDRVMAYLPVRLRLKAPRMLARLTVPLNLYDSILFVVEPVGSGDEKRSTQ
ncbi:MAG: class I SAM-dependent methyltransferase [Mesorhizobium sp.]|uniref:class I SAM-dependent methyltransferase n=1 Tax=Mesorhizobium sp. TaxID=1871066 RepID=UPI001ACFA4E9|nr:class I SAM-dependent methyltransferase [Mesorhizobium sp.]MBN9221601.1 class I SAM-dependent methyltransferase [Mesorhizobium sp.]